MRTLDLKIEDVAFGGKGVARDQGKVVFIPYTIEEEIVSAEIVSEKKQFAEAQLNEVRQPSPHRVAPECPYFGRCGGCSYQHIDYPHQLAIKFRQVRDIFQRIGKLSNVPMRPIVASPNSYAYRNRITVHVETGVVGFFRRDVHRLIDIERCPISNDEVNRLLSELRSQQPREGHYTLREGSAPRVFSQANTGVAAILADFVANLLPPGQTLLIDAYCGAGFFAKALVDKFERVIGIEWDRFAIEEARKNSTPKETYITGDVDVELSKLVAKHPAASTLIVDPPATGLTPVTRRAVLDLGPANFVYISCNPATLARDLSELKTKFTIESVTPFDMFPQTSEIEVVVFGSSR